MEEPLKQLSELALVLSKLNEAVNNLTATLTPVVPKTMILVKKVVVTSSGTAVQFPEGEVVGNEIRLSTTGNTADVYIGYSKTTVQDGVLRFGIMEDKNIPLKVDDLFELSQLWLDADTDADAVYIFCRVRVP